MLLPPLAFLAFNYSEERRNQEVRSACAPAVPLRHRLLGQGVPFPLSTWKTEVSCGTFFLASKEPKPKSQALWAARALGQESSRAGDPKAARCEPWLRDAFPEWPPAFILSFSSLPALAEGRSGPSALHNRLGFE